MVQVPAVTPVTVVPEMVQIAGVVELRVTASAELAVALSVPVPPMVIAGAVPKVMVCAVLLPLTAVAVKPKKLGQDMPMLR